MSANAGQERDRILARMQKRERVLAWTMSALSVALTICYFTLVGLQWPALDQPVFGTPLSLGTALGLACLVCFLGMTVIFTLVSNRLERAQRR